MGLFLCPQEEYKENNRQNSCITQAWLHLLDIVQIEKKSSFHNLQMDKFIFVHWSIDHFAIHLVSVWGAQFCYQKSLAAIIRSITASSQYRLCGRQLHIGEFLSCFYCFFSNTSSIKILHTQIENIASSLTLPFSNVNFTIICLDKEWE